MIYRITKYNSYSNQYARKQIGTKKYHKTTWANKRDLFEFRRLEIQNHRYKFSTINIF